MYKVMVVDDEKPARETLNYLIDWEKTSFVIVDSAKNGKEALDKYIKYKPDLIITDIQMPVMDGLEFIREVRMLKRNQKFVILSCHENFYYAKEAIKLGASDYLLKDLLTSNDLYELLEKVKRELEEEKEKFTNYNKVVFDTSDYNYKEELKNIALKSLTFENMTMEEMNNYIDKFNLNFRTSYFLVLCIFIDDYKKLTEEMKYTELKIFNYQIKKIINESIDGYFGGECFYNENGQFVAIVCLESITSQLKFYADSHTICQRIRKGMTKYMDLKLTIGVSESFHDLKNINKYYNEALNAAKLRIFMGKGKTIFYNTNIAKVKNIDMGALDKKLDELKELIDKSDIEKTKKEVEVLYNNNLSGFMQYNYLKYINSCLFNIIMENCKEHGINYIDLFECNYLPVEKPDEFETVQEICEWFSQILVKMINLQLNKDDKKYSFRIKEAIEYIEKNYNKDISLEEISDEIGLHKGYLCRLFKQETGINITDYIINYRIEKAKKLIATTNDKLYEIAEKVGFSNAQYFSLKFRKITGKTPIEYRESSNTRKAGNI